jgi:hypothetical protein
MAEGNFHQEQGYNQPSLLSQDIDEASEANMLTNRPPQLPLDQILKYMQLAHTINK